MIQETLALNKEFVYKNWCSFEPKILAAYMFLKEVDQEPYPVEHRHSIEDLTR